MAGILLISWPVTYHINKKTPMAIDCVSCIPVIFSQIKRSHDFLKGICALSSHLTYIGKAMCIPCLKRYDVEGEALLMDHTCRPALCSVFLL